jgi:hypothetical protein
VLTSDVDRTIAEIAEVEKLEKVGIRELELLTG